MEGSLRSRINNQREYTRIVCGEYRKTHREKLRNYNKEYMKEYLKDTKRRRIQYFRNIPSRIRITFDAGGDIREEYLIVYSALRAVGWTRKTESHVNHIVSLYWLINFNPDIPIDVAYCPLNLELVSKKKNHSYASRVVSKRVLAKAKELEEKFPELLKGFWEFMATKEGQLK